MSRPATAACVFDAYGTLFDVHSAVGRYSQRLGAAAGPISQLWRTKQLEYTWLRSLMGRHVDFWQITADGLDFALEAHAIDDGELRDALLNAYLTLSCYAEVPEALRQLRDQGIKLAILSNGSPKMLAAAVDGADLADYFDAVWSVEEVGIFKPDPRVYAIVTDRLGVAPEAVLFQSSNGWDAAGAAVFGFRVAWINRFDQQWERLPAKPDHVLRDLSSLPQLV